MTQTILALVDKKVLECVFPSPETEVIPGVPWGYADSVFTPAYWALQLRMADGDFGPHCFRSGETLLEETVFCLLGGHGISYEMNLATFRHLQASGLLDQPKLDAAEIAACLAQPIALGTRKVKYRFPNRRAQFVQRAHEAFYTSPAPDDPIELRTWLMELPGIGPKTASWIVRNWLDSDEVAIIDIHLHRAGILAGIFEKWEKVERHYFQMERKFLDFAKALGTKASQLDGLIWAQMREMPTAVDMELREFRLARVQSATAQLALQLC